ncbi:MAG: hypothetical protein KDA79_09585 [Planctomycetaceae bacterium]|nr:hypothetical protein [Planctomycetaceae bacterium]
MATRVLLLVMMTALFAALWSNDHPGRPATYARKPVDHPAPAVEQEPASIARPRTTPTEPENDAPAGEAAAEIQCALHPLARVVSGKVQREQNRLQLTGAELPLTLVSLPAETEPAERLEPVVAPSVRLLPREGSELDAELFVEIPEVMPSAAAPREVLAEEPAADEAAALFTDCELPLPERLAAGEYRIVNGDGLVLNRTFSAEDLTWLGATCDSGAERCQQIEADQTVWYFIRVNVEESPQPALPVLTVSAGADTTAEAAAEAGDAAPAEEAPVAGAGDVVELAQADFMEQEAALPMESRREVERARAQWLLTWWQLGCQVDWMLRRLSGATRSPGQMLWTAGVRLQQQLAVRQSSEEDRLTESPRADETR